MTVRNVQIRLAHGVLKLRQDLHENPVHHEDTDCLGLVYIPDVDSFIPSEIGSYRFRESGQWQWSVSDRMGEPPSPFRQPAFPLDFLEGLEEWAQRTGSTIRYTSTSEFVEEDEPLCVSVNIWFVGLEHLRKPERYVDSCFSRLLESIERYWENETREALDEVRSYYQR